MPRHKPISPSTVRRLALALPEATEGKHFDIADFRVRNKIFASLLNDTPTVGLKSTASNVAALVSADPVTFKDLWRGRWLGVRLDRINVGILQELIVDAWCLAAPKRLAASRAQSEKSSRV